MNKNMTPALQGLIVLTLLMAMKNPAMADRIGANDAGRSTQALASDTVKADASSCVSSNFAFKLFSQIKNGEQGNVVISPFSAYSALSMTLNGTAGTTREHMAAVLGVPANGVDALNHRNQAVFAAMVSNNDKVKLEIGNAIYADSGTPFKHEFIDLCKRLYDAEIKSVNFGSPETLKMINSWCNTKTHGKIPMILESLSRAEKMVLLNAVYFKGQWESQFKASATHDDQFTLLSNEKVPVKMMHQSGAFSYLRRSDFQALSIPYAGNRQSMYIFLPDKSADLPTFLAEFTADSWKQWMTSFSNEQVNVSLPRFTVSFSTDLSKALKAMGMSEAFIRGKANFTNMLDSGYTSWISRVLQKTYMDVNEEGTEAAAVTAVVVATCKVATTKPLRIEFRVDHPFVLALVDNDSGEILFIGLMLNPTKS